LPKVWVVGGGPFTGIDPKATAANGGKLAINECNKPTKTGHVDCD
jgi:hypothetical protein